MNQEKLKIIINLLSNLLILVLGAFFGLLAYVVVNYKTIDTIQMVLSGIAGVVLIFAIVVIVILLKKNLNCVGEIK